jgi:hypothetical protein
MFCVVGCKVDFSLASTPREFRSQYCFCLYRSQIALPFAAHSRASRFLFKLAGRNNALLPSSIAEHGEECDLAQANGFTSASS